MKLEYIIKNLIQNNKIKTQLELTNILQKKGVVTTQSNISRILKKLNTVKIVDENKNTYYVIQTRPLDIFDRIKTLITNIENNGYLIVIKTRHGAAPLIGNAIEERHINRVLSIISGENYVIVIPDNVRNLDELYINLRGTFMPLDNNKK